MISTLLAQQIRENCGFTPTGQQDEAITRISRFLLAKDNETIFLLKGYAGTGKTSLAAAIVKTLGMIKAKAVLLAPTGRAAKVFSLYSGHKAYTIHKAIYRQKVFSPEMNNFVMGRNLARDTVFIVDEASMIANYGGGEAHFGSGRLLEDLITFVYSGDNCKLVMIGDTAQLPPVGESESPALSRAALGDTGFKVEQVELCEVVRQAEGSGILANATAIREIIRARAEVDRIRLAVTPYPDIKRVRGDELIDAISDCYARDGMDETIVITRSNKRANIYNMGIRNTILYREEELERGDIIMIAKNNYAADLTGTDIEFIANGDIAVVRRVRHSTDVYGLRFADVTMTFPDYDNFELEMKVILDTLHSESASLGREQSERLFQGVYDSYDDVTNKRDRMKKVKADPYYNALQIKYAYAVTCHKAQGGQWTNIFLDHGFIPEGAVDTDYLRWLYTAVTRARGTLYLVNYPDDECV
ncbi:MAG TPA: AAA family ATPase [Candidatus Avibacteroides faecavium]|nr:AAA family ATPase [Candidatus Avibacteroides faecavium]